MANEQDKDNDMQENKKDKSRKSAIITGVICVLLCIIGALYIWHKQTQKPPVQLDVNSAIATVDIDKLMSKHSDYAKFCLLYTSPSPRDGLLSRMPSSA